MAQVTLTVNGTPYQFSCRDGEEQRLQELAAVIDAKVDTLAGTMGRVGDAKLLLMAGLLLLDEMSDQNAGVKVPEAELAAHVGTIDSLASEIDNIAASLESA